MMFDGKRGKPSAVGTADALTPLLAETDPEAPGQTPPDAPALPRRGRLRGVWIVLGCVLAVALTAAAPAAMFALGDMARFSRPADADRPYVSRTVDGDDLYLVRMLHERQEAALAASLGGQDSGQPLYLSASFSYETMQFDSGLVTRCAAMLRQLADGGVLPYNWISGVLAAASTNAWTFRGSSDSLGFTTIGYFPGENDGSQQMSMTLESRTGKLVSLQLTQTVAADPPDTATVLYAWVAMNDLDILGDWAPPAGTQWESSGLYSARGQLLATCVSAFDDAAGRMVLSLDLVPCTEDELTASAAAEPARAGLTDGALMVRMGQRSDMLWQYSFNTGSSLYYLSPIEGGYSRLMRLDYDSYTCGCGCRKAGCGHRDASCPAVLPQDGPLFVDAAGRVYLWPHSGELAVDDLSTPATLLCFDPAANETSSVATLYNGAALTPLAVRDNVLYVRQAANAADRAENDPAPDTVLAVDLAAGSRTATPTLLARDETVAGVQGSCLVTVRRRDPRAAVSGLTTPLFLSEPLSTAVQLEVDLLDPATGQRWQVAALDGAALASANRLTESAWLFCTWSGAAGADTAGEASLWAVDLETGIVDGYTFLPPYLSSNLKTIGGWMADTPANADCSIPPWLYLPQVEQGETGLADCLYMLDSGDTLRIVPGLYSSGWEIVAAADDGRLVLRATTSEPNNAPFALLYPGELELLRPEEYPRADEVG